MFTEQRARRRIRNAFSRYLAPDLVDELANDPSRLKLGGEMRPMTLLFSDIRGFTSISEGMDAQNAHAVSQRLPDADDRRHSETPGHHRQIYGRRGDGVLERAHGRP